MEKTGRRRLHYGSIVSNDRMSDTGGERFKASARVKLAKRTPSLADEDPGPLTVVRIGGTDDVTATAG